MRRGLRCCTKALPAPIGCARPSRQTEPSASKTCCIAAHAILAKSAAPGPWNWPPRSASARDHRPRDLRRECAPSAQAAEHQLEARQALDHQPRAAVPTKKNARDRLIAWASTQSHWAIGYLDEVWWSRFALPRLHAWQDEDH